MHATFTSLQTLHDRLLLVTHYTSLSICKGMKLVTEVLLYYGKSSKIVQEKKQLKYRISFCFIKHLTVIHCTHQDKHKTDLSSIFYMKFTKKTFSKLQSKSP